MMPKGVEHDELEIVTQIIQTVRIPMMPKGVEHSVLGGTVPRLLL